MKINSEYRDRLEYKLFYGLLESVINSHLAETPLCDGYFLHVSKYLNLSIVSSAVSCTEEGGEFYPLTTLVDSVDPVEINATELDALCYKYIIAPGEKPLTKEDVLNNRMIEAYEAGHFPTILDPYFQWKKHELPTDDFSVAQLQCMKEEVSRLMDVIEEKHPDGHRNHDRFIVDDPWQFTRGFGEDKYMMAYLMYIDEQLTDIQQCIN